MMFGAMAGWQAWALLAGIAAAATGLFYVKVRPPRLNVPSLLLWRRVLDQARTVSWWERIRRAVSLVATIAIALGLTLALTRPGPRAMTGAGGRLLIVLDSSWSMLARTSGGETRWARAVAQAHALAASAAGETIALATTADGLVEGPTSDTPLIDIAIDHLAPSGGEGGDWPRVAQTGTVHFITDGALQRPLGKDVVVHSVYDPAPNVAVTALDVRRSLSGESAGEAYMEIVNYAPTAQQVQLSISRGPDVLFDKPVDMAAGEAVRQVLQLDARGDARLRVHVAAPHNALAVDDDAVAWIEGVDVIAVTVVSDQPAALVSLLERAPGVRVSVVAPAAYRPGREDAVIFDRWLPPSAPVRPALYLQPPPAPWLGASGADEKSPRWAGTSSHPVLSGVDPLTIDIKHVKTYEGAGLVPIAKSERGTTLVAVSDQPQRRAVVLTFSLGDSNLALAPAFPVFVGNALEWLARPANGPSRRPGPVTLPASTTLLTAPDGRPVPLSHVGEATIARLPAPGFYLADIGGSRSVIAANVGDPHVSDLSRTHVSQTARAAAGSIVSSRPWWLYALMFAFILVAAEWWTWQRRITV